MDRVLQYFKDIQTIQRKLNLDDSNGVKLVHREDGYTSIVSLIDHDDPYTWKCVRTFDTIQEYFDWLQD